MTTLQLPGELIDVEATSARAIEIVIPVHNEEHDLKLSVRRLHTYLMATFPLSFRITIADNASTDGTWGIACALEAELANVHATYVSKKGRGRALHMAWMASTAEAVCYMDVEMSTDLSALLPLVAPLLSGHSDVAIGTRLARSSRVVRGPKREVISRCYNVLLRTTLATQFSDAQCGFKAMRADRARELLPIVQDNGWFFDTELLVLAERSGMRIHEVPVDWIDDPDSRVESGYQLATGDPVMAIGGFNGSDPAPTLAQFEKLVTAGKIHYFIAGSVGTPNGGSNASSEISSWVSSHYTAVTIGGVTLYDLAIGQSGKH